MELRKSVPPDLLPIMSIIDEAKNYFCKNGIDQWQNGYPDHDTIKLDMKNGCSYVLTGEGGVIGTAAIVFTGEETYGEISGGSWLTDGDYAVIHRIAVRESCKGEGLASHILDGARDLTIKKGFGSIRVDTHRDNFSMQRLLKKTGFEYCGIIHLKDKSERLAFEKVLKI